jgi:hypothetical protein
MNEETGLNKDVSAQSTPNIKLLEIIYENLRALYNNCSQWITLLSAAWAVITGFGFQKDSRSAFLVFVGGIVLILISYELSRAGIGIGSLAIMGLIYESRIGVQPEQSYIVGTLLSLRGCRFTEKIIQYSKLGNNFNWLESIKDRSDYNFYHIKHSKTSLITLVGGGIQCILAIYLCVLGTLPVI